MVLHDAYECWVCCNIKLCSKIAELICSLMIALFAHNLEFETKTPVWNQRLTQIVQNESFNKRFQPAVEFQDEKLSHFTKWMLADYRKCSVLSHETWHLCWQNWQSFLKFSKVERAFSHIGEFLFSPMQSATLCDAWKSIQKQYIPSHFQISPHIWQLCLQLFGSHNILGPTSVHP